MSTSAELLDYAPELATLREEVLDGLRSAPKTLPCKYLYDATGSHLFEAICTLDAYYPTRTELAIMDRHIDEMAGHLGKGCLLIEYGSGSGLKTQILLDALEAPAGYVPIEISREHLERSARHLARRFPDLEVLPVCADYTSEYQIPVPQQAVERRAVYFPGSTIGNFDRSESVAFLRKIARVCGSGGALLIGVDLQKPSEVLELAYNDPAGVTAAFNLNLLQRLNCDLDADFDLQRFRHRAIYDPDLGRIEMHLESLEAQTVAIGGEAVNFEAGETICTEHSNKYTLDSFRQLSDAAGFDVQQIWTDEQGWFSVQLLIVR